MAVVETKNSDVNGNSALEDRAVAESCVVASLKELLDGGADALKERDANMIRDMIDTVESRDFSSGEKALLIDGNIRILDGYVPGYFSNSLGKDYLERIITKSRGLRDFYSKQSNASAPSVAPAAASQMPRNGKVDFASLDLSVQKP
jgi:hypothetical protein